MITFNKKNKDKGKQAKNLEQNDLVTQKASYLLCPKKEKVDTQVCENEV